MTTTRKPPQAARAASKAAWPYWLRESLWPLAFGGLALLTGMALGISPAWSSPTALASLLVALVCLAALPVLRVWPGLLLAAAAAAICVVMGQLAGEWPRHALLALVGGHSAFLARRAAAADTPRVQAGATSAPSHATGAALGSADPAALESAFANR